MLQFIKVNFLSEHSVYYFLWFKCIFSFITQQVLENYSFL